MFRITLCLFVFLLPLNFLNAQQLWGTTSDGGVYSWGTIFSMNPDGYNFAVQHDFDLTLGGTPMGNLCLGSDGLFYGTCYDGGANGSCVIYSIDPVNNDFVNLWDFDIFTGDFPQSGMVEHNGKLYGVASGSIVGADVGVVYSLDMATSTYVMEYQMFSNHGKMPRSQPLIIGNELWGTAMNGDFGVYGTIFKYDIDLDILSVEHQFLNAMNGVTPAGSLIDVNGILYGLADGGANSGGVIYSFDPNTGFYNVEYDLPSNSGGGPEGSLCLAPNGLLYGMTQSGGVNGLGSLFSFDPVTNLFNELVSLDNSTGFNPVGDLLEMNGYLYGECITDSLGCGTIFRYNIAMDDFEVLRVLQGSDGCMPKYGTVQPLAFQGLDQQAQISVDIFPNPATDFVRIEGLNISEIKLFDLTGKELHCKQNKVATSQSHHVDLDLSLLHPGTYLLEIESDGNTVSKSIVKL